MFDDIGGKIKGVATIWCWIGIAVCVVTGFFMWVTDEDLFLAGLLVMFLGSLISWVSSFLLYGFGQLIQNSDIIAHKYEREYKEYLQKEEETRQEKIEQHNKEVKEAFVNDNDKIVDNNDETEDFVDIYCTSCGNKLSYTKEDFRCQEVLVCPHCDNEIDTRIFLN